MDARKTRIGADDLGDRFTGAARVTCVRRKSSTTFAPGDAELAAAALGRSGNLKAPSIRVGTRWLVGFSEAAWAAFFDERTTGSGT